MAFRRKKDGWRQFLQKHSEGLTFCGIPEEVYRDRRRFIVFLEHGYDEWGWFENHHAFFHPRVLSDEQIAHLAKLVADHIGEEYRIPVASRWTRLF